VVNSKKSWGPYNTIELKGKHLKEMMDLWKASNFSGTKNQSIQKKPEVIYLNWAPFNDWSSISLSSVERLTEEQLNVLARMATTFSLSYTRFLDLQKAEAQAREAQIEAALERVRAASMAMHHSNELTETVALVYRELSKLGFDLWSCLIRTRDPERDGFTTWLTLKEIIQSTEKY